jgi:hypothetical protein
MIWAMAFMMAMITQTGGEARAGLRNGRKVLAEFSGSALPYIFAAKDEIKRRQPDFARFQVSVIQEDEDTVIVMLVEPGKSPMVRGGLGMEVELRKSDATVVKSYYIK